MNARRLAVRAWRVTPLYLLAALVMRMRAAHREDQAVIETAMRQAWARHPANPEYLEWLRISKTLKAEMGPMSDMDEVA